MSLLRAVIIDDEEAGVETLRLILNKYVSEVKIVGEATKASQGLKLIEDFLPEIVFLDINMPEMNGFELLQKLRWRKFNLVFTTAHQEFGLKALKEQAIDYLLKPIDPKELRVAVDRIKNRLEAAADDTFNYELLNTINQAHIYKIGINSKTGIDYVDPRDILFMESKSNYTLVQLNNGKEILSPKTLKEYELQLCDDDANFMRIHHSWIINLRKVQRYLKDQETIVMTDNRKIPISKSKKNIFYRWMGIS